MTDKAIQHRWLVLKRAFESAAKIGQFSKEEVEVRYLELTAFASEALVPMVAIAQLWWQQSGLPLQASLSLTEQMMRVRLLEPLEGGVRQGSSMRMPEGLLWVARSRIDGRGQAALQRAVLASLGLPAPELWVEPHGPFSEETPEALLGEHDYVWQYLTWHVRQAHGIEALNRLLCSQRWLASRLLRDGVHSLIGDFDALKVAPSTSDPAAPSRAPQQASLLLKVLNAERELLSRTPKALESALRAGLPATHVALAGSVALSI